jgi:glycosyltransferase XagB
MANGPTATSDSARGALPDRIPPSLPACPEIDCLRHLLPPGLIAWAELRAVEVGVGADQVLIAADIISEEAYAAALTAAEGLKFKSLERVARDQIRIANERLPIADACGILPITVNGNQEFVIAPNGRSARELVTRLRAGDTLAATFRITTPDRLRKLVSTLAVNEIRKRATSDLRTARPDLSAAGLAPSLHKVLIAIVAATLLLALMPLSALKVLGVAFAFFFVAWSGLRIASPLLTRAPSYPRVGFGLDELPVYTIIVPLYRETAAVKDLIAALQKLNYPKEKLDVKLMLEPDDRETRVRLQGMRLGAPFEIIVAPPCTPRTKPKALNAALPFARGAIIAIYDAEDRPEPDQLLRALDAFAAEGKHLACVQARLTIDNTADNWLTRGIMAQTPQRFSCA